MKSILPPTYLLVSIVLIFPLHLFIPVRKILFFPWNLIGLMPLLIGIIINLLADRQFKDSNTTVKPFEKSTSLITEGVFRISWNPMYFGFVCILLGIVVLVGTLSSYLVVVVFLLLMDRIFIRTEERMLESEFGKEWHDYKNKTRRWI